jgi:ankyrin repeat protein
MSSFWLSLPLDLRRLTVKYLEDKDYQKIDVAFLEDENDVFWRQKLTDKISCKGAYELIDKIFNFNDVQFIVDYNLLEVYMRTNIWDSYLIKSLIYHHSLSKNINIRDRRGITMLMIVSDWHDIEKMKKLINAGADVNLKSSVGESALCYAAFTPNSYDSLKLLIDAGADVNVRYSPEEHTLLMHSASYRDVKILQLFVDSKADLNCQDNKGYTALMFAAQRDDLTILKLLVNAGADLNLQNINGDTALTLSMDTGRVDNFRFLLESGTNIHLRDMNGEDALSFSLEHDIEYTKMLLKAGGNIHARDNYGDSFITVAKTLAEWETIYPLIKGEYIAYKKYNHRVKTCQQRNKIHNRKLRRTKKR